MPDICKCTSAPLWAAAVAITLGLAGCHRGDRFSIGGEVYGGEGEKIVLEKADFQGNWTVIDSTRISKQGRFGFRGARPAGGEIYRLRMGDGYVYVPIDSTERITVSTRASSFGSGYTLSGSRGAERLMEFEKSLQAFLPHAADPDSAAAFKRRVYTAYIQDAPASVTSYYILTKTLPGGEPLYDMTGGEDTRYLAAVATAYDVYRPQDPHAAMLKHFALENAKRKNSDRGAAREIVAEEIEFPEILLQDEKGKSVSLRQIASNGRPVVVAFSNMTDSEAPTRNRRLNQLYQSGRAAIYQVSFDADRYTWREGASNLPWTTVIDPGGQTSDALRDYNIQQLPWYYLIDASGHLVRGGATIDAIL